MDRRLIPSGWMSTRPGAVRRPHRARIGTDPAISVSRTSARRRLSRISHFPSTRAATTGCPRVRQRILDHGHLDVVAGQARLQQRKILHAARRARALSPGTPDAERVRREDHRSQAELVRQQLSLAAANVFLGRELRGPLGLLDQRAMNVRRRPAAGRAGMPASIRGSWSARCESAISN